MHNFTMSKILSQTLHLFQYEKKREREIVMTSTTTTAETSATMRKRRSRNILKIAYISKFRILKLPWNIQGVDSIERFWLIILLCNRMSILYAIIQKCMGSFFQNWIILQDTWKPNRIIAYHVWHSVSFSRYTIFL